MPITRSKRRLEEVSEDQEPDYTNKKTHIFFTYAYAISVQICLTLCRI